MTLICSNCGEKRKKNQAQSEYEAAEKWELSEREKEIIKNLGGKKTNESAR